MPEIDQNGLEYERCGGQECPRSALEETGKVRGFRLGLSRNFLFSPANL
jgi:hypothetical protein